MITNLANLEVGPLLEQNPTPPVQGPEFGGSSPIGLLVTLLLLIALIFLIRSMNRHLRKVPGSFDQPGEQRSGHAPESEGRVSAREPDAGKAGAESANNAAERAKPTDGGGAASTGE